jgi:hypothetical protein
VGARFSVRRELTLALLVYGLYLLVARVVLRRDGRARAHGNAGRVVALEKRLGIHVEPGLQRAVLRFPRVVHGLNVGYGVFNFGLSAGLGAYLFRRRDDWYHAFRTATLLGHVGAQPVFLLFPTAPPRTQDGFVDTLAEVSGFDLEHPRLVRLYNPVAAMPSLHVTFAVVTGLSIAERSRSRAVKSAAYGYPLLVSFVIAATGNHYVLDAGAGAALGVAARRAIGSRRRPPAGRARSVEKCLALRP